ncbi:MAG: ERCC4 domain-containing protein [Candidatus Bathyarchaeota archaeon]
MAENLNIIVDTREPDCIISMLTALGMDVNRRMIGVGDYILSHEYAVERKTTSDFMSSMFNGRLFEQAENLANSYSKPIIILEGDIAEELERRVNPRAFWGALLRLEVDRGIPVIPTMTYSHTVDLLYTLAKRLQSKKREKIPVYKPKLLTDEDWQIYIVASLPNVGGELSKRLLKKFKTARAVFQARANDLVKVEGIGQTKAERITHALDKRYKDK